MVDPLNAWWGQQLVLCDWAFEPDPCAVKPSLAASRLEELGVPDRGELGWRLIEAFVSDHLAPARQLHALELLALAAAAAWLSVQRARAWMVQLADRIHAQHAGLEDWLQALRRARGAEGWARGDLGFVDACEALATLESEGDGVTWALLGNCLEAEPRAEPPWSSLPGQRVWRLRAAFAPPLCLPPRQELDWPDVDGWLKQEWQVEDRAALIQTLLWLAGQGDRYGWDLDAIRLVEHTPQERTAWLDGLGEGLAYGQTLMRFLEKGEPLEWAAWDWLRLVDLAYAGWCMEWLSEEEAQAFAAHGADLLGRRYSDWIAVVQAYQRGRSLFEGRDNMADIQNDWALLLHSPASPWQETLQTLLDEETREASRRAMHDRRRDPRHWVLALASLRAPELLQRQWLDLPPDAAQRSEASQYLRDILGIHPQEGIAGLARFWLPAQAHHLNQLAADASHGALPSPVTPLGRASQPAVEQREALKGCVRHAATIHMGEKYAFYLQMALDSGEFEPQRLEPLIAALRSVLCHFYPFPRRLLDAWACWDKTLPELDDQGNPIPSLEKDILWHRDDPGSPFHWLDWQVASSHWQEPAPRPSLSKFTALSLAGPLNANVWSEPWPESEREAQGIREWIDGHYGLHGPGELQEFLEFLREAGDRQDYQINYAPYTLNVKRLEAEIAILESDDCSEEERHHLLRLKRVRDNEADCNEVDMAAWDVAQLVDLAIAGRQLAWLDQPRFESLLDAALALAERHYAGWQDYARGLYAGFAFFMGETEERDMFLQGFRDSLVAWLCAAPPLAGPWASLDFPGARPRHWAPLHIDILPGDQRRLH
ncbi:DUF1266 domain-containing protein [Pistricoccus aurantiacus]|uniref:DUF1266 domain-containing protein n=1 Tax=Pistricoccus aurantiacus TaxID=1883414 RepID=UPI0036343A46